MQVLVFNCGSSSLTFKIFDIVESKVRSAVLSGKAHRVGVTGSEASFIEYSWNGKQEKQTVPLENHATAASHAMRFFKQQGIAVDAVGHRFVHGGGHFATSSMLNETTLARLERTLPLAPIHNPISLSVIHEARAAYPGVAEYVTFDTAFHSSIPPRASTYALPEWVRRTYGFRKYGFHGLSYTYVARSAIEHLRLNPETSRIVACHLGTGGSSVVAIQGGKSIDTSMGYSPLPGLVMSTRSGDIDPMLLLYLMGTAGMSAEEIETLLNKKSGLIGVSQYSSDLRDILRRIGSEEEPRADLAFSMYCHRLLKYVGGYIMALGGIDALVFTDDIGVTNWHVRERVCGRLLWAGVELDPAKNRAALRSSISRVSILGSVPVLTVPTEEELVIAWEGAALLQGVKV